MNDNTFLKSSKKNKTKPMGYSRERRDERLRNKDYEMEHISQTVTIKKGLIKV